MRRILLITTLFVCAFAWAQQKSPQQMGGVYYAYPIENGEATPYIQDAPEGYKPFYISHYGRHGSRWLTNDARYIWVNKHFDDDKNLTKLGKSVKKRLAKVWENAQGNGGQLTALGARQHRGIAKRMYQNFPQLFTADAPTLPAKSYCTPFKIRFSSSDILITILYVGVDPVTQQTIYLVPDCTTAS